ncbi:hypothetical protein AB0K16_24985 [Nonomuraea jabiensis]|uniref:hypothetical protein n=1 Tax=Nonomuraea jabiensis TaxID=882448 RepID=UPI0034331E22
MSYLMKKLLVAAALVTASVTVTTTASAQSGALFDGFGRGVAEDTALADAENAARQNALVHGFTACDVFESVVSQDARTHVFFALVTVRCEDEAALG